MLEEASSISDEENKVDKTFVPDSEAFSMSALRDSLFDSTTQQVFTLTTT